MPTSFRIGCSTTFTPDLPSISDGREGPGNTKLITEEGIIQVWSANRETDARTALSRGLAEYVQGLQIEFNRATYTFARVFENWAAPEDNATYPSAVVYATGEGSYDSSGFTPKINRRDRVPDHINGGFDPKNGRYVQTASELVQDVTVEIWANDTQERQALVAMLEDAMVPVDWRYGPLLEFPHYHNARASFEKLSLTYDDTEIDAIRRYRRATMIIRGKVPVVKIVRFGNFDAERPARIDVGVE